MQYILTQEEYDELKDTDHVAEAVSEYSSFLEWLEVSAEEASASMPKLKSFDANSFHPITHEDTRYGMQQFFVAELIRRVKELK